MHSRALESCHPPALCTCVQFHVHVHRGAAPAASTLFSGSGPCSRCAAAVQVAAQSAVVLVVSGPSGVGKDAVVARLRELRPGLHFVVTATSRCALLLPPAGSALLRVLHMRGAVAACGARAVCVG